MNRAAKFLPSFLVFISAFLLVGCQTTDKSQAFIGTGENLTYACSYNQTENTTTIKINSYIQNDTIYTIEKVTIAANLYLDDTLVKEKGEVTFGFNVNHGQTKSFTFNTYYDGEANRFEFVSWTATYKTLWDSYAPWFIASIVIAAVVLLIFIIVMLIQDLEFDDIIDFFEDHLWILPFVLMFFIPYLISGISLGSWSWIPPVIIGGAVVSVVVLGLIALGIKYLFTDVFGFGLGFDFCVGDQGKQESSDSKVVDEEGKEYTIDDLKNDEEGLMAFNKEQLIEWCRKNELTGYSKLNKLKLVDFIINSNRNDETEEKQSPSHKGKNTFIVPMNNKGITFGDIAGLEEAKKAFREKVIMPIKHKELYEKFNKKVGGGILLYGLPGTGKTMFAEAASNELDALFIPVKCSDIKSKWYGESEQRVKEIFAKARKAKMY